MVGEEESCFRLRASHEECDRRIEYVKGQSSVIPAIGVYSSEKVLYSERNASVELHCAFL